MATTADLLTDSFGRIGEEVHAAVEGLSAEQLNARIADHANSMSWLIWHLTRIQDDHLAEVMGTEQVWRADGWCDRFGLPLPADAIGYGHGPDEVSAVVVESGDLLTGYFDAVLEKSLGYLAELSDVDLDRIVDRTWDPPVTLAVRLVSVISDDLQHVGQAAFLRGLALS